jgi:hypothetical protein
MISHSKPACARMILLDQFSELLPGIVGKRTPNGPSEGICWRARCQT